jgi:hypothetical protein
MIDPDRLSHMTDRLEVAVLRHEDIPSLCRAFFGSVQGEELAREIQIDTAGVWERGTLLQRWKQREERAGRSL